MKRLIGTMSSNRVAPININKCYVKTRGQINIKSINVNIYFIRLHL